MLLTLFVFIVPIISALNTDNLLMNNLQTLSNLQNIPSLPSIGNLNTLNSLAFPSYDAGLSQQSQQQQQQQQPQFQPQQEERIPCSCGVFLNGQFRRGSSDPPRGNPALLQELNDPFQCNTVGERQCTNKCLETIMRHLPNSPIMVCGSIDRDCHKERAYLFVKNCKDRWINTNLSAGREYCCKDGAPYKCPPS